MANVTVAENAGQAVLVLKKSAKASSYSKVRVYTVAGGSCPAGAFTPLDVTLTVGNSVLTMNQPLKIVDNQAAGGDCTVLVKLAAVRFASVQATPATVTVKDNETAPVTGKWVAAPLQVSGYAALKSQGTGGLVIKLAWSEMSNDADPAQRQRIWHGFYVADASGNFPPIIGTDYWTKYEFRWNESDILGLMPAAVAPATGMQPTYGDQVTALSACVGQTEPDALVPGAAYVVKGLRTHHDPATPTTPMNLPDTVVLNPVVPDGKHMGDGWFGLTVPMSCVQKSAPAMLLRAAAPLKTPTRPTGEVMVATRDCRDLFNAKNPANEDYNFISKGQAFSVTPAEPGAVFAVPLNRALGTVHASENCFR
jgi:hypothetical protein